MIKKIRVLHVEVDFEHVLRDSSHFKYTFKVKAKPVPQPHGQVPRDEDLKVVKVESCDVTWYLTKYIGAVLDFSMCKARKLGYWTRVEIDENFMLWKIHRDHCMHAHRNHCLLTIVPPGQHGLGPAQPAGFVPGLRRPWREGQLRRMQPLQDLDEQGEGRGEEEER